MKRMYIFHFHDAPMVFSFLPFRLLISPFSYRRASPICLTKFDSTLLAKVSVIWNVPVVVVVPSPAPVHVVVLSSMPIVAPALAKS